MTDYEEMKQLFTNSALSSMSIETMVRSFRNMMNTTFHISLIKNGNISVQEREKIVKDHSLNFYYINNI